MHTAKLIPQNISCTAYQKESLASQGIYGKILVGTGEHIS